MDQIIEELLACLEKREAERGQLDSTVVYGRHLVKSYRAMQRASIVIGNLHQEKLDQLLPTMEGINVWDKLQKLACETI